MQVVWPKKGKVPARGADPDPVHAHKPGVRLAGVPQDPGVSGAVPLVRHPAVPARLLRPRLVGALEGEVLEALLPVAEIPAIHAFDRRRGAMVAGGFFEPSLLAEQRHSLLEFSSYAHRSAPDRERPGS